MQMSNPVFWEKYNQYLSSAEFAQSVVKVHVQFPPSQLPLYLKYLKFHAFDFCLCIFYHCKLLVNNVKEKVKFMLCG